MSDQYLWDGSGDPEPTVRELEATLSVLRYQGDWSPRARGNRLRWAVVASVTTAAAAVAALALTRPAVPRDLPIDRERAATASDSSAVAPPAGVLTAAEAGAVVVGQQRNLSRECWQPLVSAGTAPNAAKLTLALSIRPNGSVSSVSVTGDPTADQSLGRCVARAARRWRFPSSDAVTRLNVPVTFVSPAATPRPSTPKAALSAPPALSAAPDVSATPEPDAQLGAQEIRAVISKNAAAVRQQCWTAARKARGSSAKLTLRLVIAPSGAVSSASAPDPVGQPGLGACVASQARTWRFPASSSATTVSVPFVFAID